MSYQSPHIHIDGIDLDVRADAEGVTLGRTVDGVYASDLFIANPDIACRLAALLVKAAQKVRQARGNGGRS